MIDVREFIGCPFRDGGRGEYDPYTRKAFYDCWGLAQAVFHKFGVMVPDYGRGISCFASAEAYEQFKRCIGDWVQIQTPEEPCLVAMRFNREAPEMVQHYGVYVGQGKVLHILNKTQSILSNIADTYYKRVIEGFYQWKKA
jgi:cell wall-associated NlpC family hydrolase